MIRPLGTSLLALPMLAVLTFGAAAQTREPTQGLMGLFQQEAQAQPSTSREIESDGLPPPGLAPQDVRPQFGNQTGHQFGEQPRTQFAPPDEAIRPPGGIGAGASGPSQAPGQLPSQATAPGAGQPPAPTVMSLPADDQPEQGQPKELPAHLKKQLVDYSTKEPVGTIIVDTANTYLFLVLGNGKALRYGVRVGRDGFTWTGTERISRMKEWPDWHPPAEMIERQPYLPRFMAGGNGNPLGARAMYLGTTLYRIHGTNQPSTIGSYVSSGCVGMLNEDVEDLFSRVQVGTRVVVLPGRAPDTLANAGPPPPANPMAPPSQVRSSAPVNVAPANNQGGMTGSSLPPAR
jgi:lipoprotein-anchoring transpeptidase ErfK/SrfK